MKISQIKSETNIQDGPKGHDIDVSAKLGPAIHKNMSGLEALCKLIPGDKNEIATKLKDLKACIAQKVSLQSNVLEVEVANDEPVQECEITPDTINEMYDEFFPSIGESAWVAIKKRLSSLNIGQDAVNDLIDAAIMSRK